MGARFIGVFTRIADVVDQWDKATHDWGGKAAWRLFNAATFALAGKVVEQSDIPPPAQDH